QRDFTDVGARSVSWGFLGGPRWAGYAAMRLRTTEVAVKPLLRSMFASLGTRLKGIALANGGSTPIDGTLEGKRCGGALLLMIPLRRFSNVSRLSDHHTARDIAKW